MNQQLRWILYWFCLCLASHALIGQNSPPDRKQRGEEAKDYFKKWLEEDVVYIITEQEKSVFKSLTTPEEKEKFIEQFWLRRDEDPSTPTNEFKAEHYRRIAYANEHFPAGYPGWLTDRGRIYILYGPPDQMENHSAGETYDRPLREGGGQTSTYPFQTWRYRHIAGVGDDVELEFVDRTLSGEYRLAVYADEKDALANVLGAGPTLLEQMELSDKTERGTRQELGFARQKDSLFARYENYARVLSPKKIEYTDLKAIVDVNAQFEDLPFEVRCDYLRLNEDQVLALVSLRIDHHNLDFASGDGGRFARLAIYGSVTTLTRKVVQEFEDNIEARSSDSTGGATLGSVYQKIVPLEGDTRYKLSLVVKDLTNQKIGVVQRVMTPPRFGDGQLSGSSLLLADSIRSIKPQAGEEMFVIGDLKVVPNLTREFKRVNPLGVYFQVYNAAIDSATSAHALSIAYRIFKEGRLVEESDDPDGQSIQYQSEVRVVLAKGLSLKSLETGQYRLEIEVHDRIGDKRLSLREEFKIVG